MALAPRGMNAIAMIQRCLQHGSAAPDEGASRVQPERGRDDGWEPARQDKRAPDLDWEPDVTLLIV